MNISLDPQTEALIRNRVQEGKYSSPAAVIRQALLALEHQESEDREELEELRQLIAEADHSGPPTPFDAEEFIAEQMPHWEKLSQKGR